MAGVLITYWSGALRRLQAEVDGLSRVIEHNLTMGEENEAALSRMLVNFIPGRFGTGSGLLLDSTDKQSKQADVVIFEKSADAAIFAQTTQLLFPVESVYATIEVKTSLSADDVVKVGKAVARLKELTSTKPHADGLSRPLICLFAYSAWAKPSTVLEHLMNLPAEQRPDLVLVVSSAFVAGEGSYLGWDTPDFAGGQAFVADGPSEDAQPVVMATKADQVVYNGHTFNTFATESLTERKLCDSPRALLIFLEAFLSALQKKVDGTEPFMRHYMTSSFRKVDPV